MGDSKTRPEGSVAGNIAAKAIFRECKILKKSLLVKTIMQVLILIGLDGRKLPEWLRSVEFKEFAETGAKCGWARVVKTAETVEPTGVVSGRRRGD